VEVSPDSSTHGRAQRIRTQASGQGIAQWTWLPLHRVREFEVEVFGRAPQAVRLTLWRFTNWARAHL
jgi:hypothetical protein